MNSNENDNTLTTLYPLPPAESGTPFPLWHIPQVAPLPLPTITTPRNECTDAIPLIFSPATYLSNMSRSTRGWGATDSRPIRRVVKVQHEIDVVHGELVEELVKFKVNEERKENGQSVEVKQKGSIRVRKDLGGRF